MSTAALLEVHMQDPTGREFGVDAHFVGDSIEQLVGYPDRKDILNQNRHDRYSFVVVLHIMTEGRLRRRGKASRRFRCSFAPAPADNLFSVPDLRAIAAATPTTTRPSTSAPSLIGPIMDTASNLGGAMAVQLNHTIVPCLLYTSDAADEEDSVDL